MTGRLRLLPDGLAGRFAVLLTTALVLANVIALAILVFERTRINRDALWETELERVVSLVPILENADPRDRRRIARSASTRQSRISLDPGPVVVEAEGGRLIQRFMERLSVELEGREVRAAFSMRRDTRGGSEQRNVLLVSIALETGTQSAGVLPRWLNVVSNVNRGRPPGVRGEVLLLVLGLSLAIVLSVGLHFVRRLTTPLRDYAAAARAAGDGDRSVRVAETGALEMREAARAFNDMQDRIAQFDAERMRTLAAVGHDLRTPITSLRIRAEMLDEKEAEPMIRTLDEMVVMADGLVAFAKGAGENEGQQEIDLNDLLTHVTAQRGAGFEPGPPLKLTGRPVALSRAFGNIIDNAMRYAGSATVRASQREGVMVVTVEDDGPGIAPEALDDVFEPFMRGDASRSTETGGAGLGLSIARNIIVGHGGTIRLENRPEGGLRVTVELPTKPASVGRAPEA